MTNGYIVKQSDINRKRYDGTTDKFGITVKNQDYIVKMQKLTESNEYSDIYSEYVAQRIIEAVGIPCHEVWIGQYDTKLVSILKDFTNNDYKLRTYGETKQSSEGTEIENKAYTYDDVLYMIDKHTKMSKSNKDETIRRFWQMFIMDAILGNRDRHRGNWGYLMHNNECMPAPLFDNGASLFPDLGKRIGDYKNSIACGTERQFIAERSEKFPAQQFQMKRIDGTIKKTNFYETFSNIDKYDILKRETDNIKNQIGFDKLFNIAYNLVVTTSEIPQIYKRFYVIIVCVRYLHIIERMDIDKAYDITMSKLGGRLIV